MSEPPRAPSNTEQNQYARHNAPREGDTRHCVCERCLRFRQQWPRTAATLDGEAETARRVVLYKRGEYR